MSTPQTAQSAKQRASAKNGSPVGRNGILNGHPAITIHGGGAVEGHTSPQATFGATPKSPPPAGTQAGRDHGPSDLHRGSVPAAVIPGAQACRGTQSSGGTGEQSPPAASSGTSPISSSPLAHPLLALAADVLSDLEKVRIANENRLRQLTRSEEDKDGETRGFGLDEAHPDVARLAALVGMLAEAEHKAALNVARLMRGHPLGPWVKAQKGIGEKQGARLLAAIGDPYIRPEIVREDGTVEPSRPRLVSELWAFSGYHVIPVGQVHGDTHIRAAGGEQDSHPGQLEAGTQVVLAGVAPKRARGQKANWSAAAKMRAFLVAESCIKQLDGHHRKVYDATRAKYADAVHAAECVRCGPAGKPAQPGSPLSDGHKHARGLRAVAKEVLRDLWREAKRLHELASASGQWLPDAQDPRAADGLDVPAGHNGSDIHPLLASGEQDGHETAD